MAFVVDFDAVYLGGGHVSCLLCSGLLSGPLLGQCCPWFERGPLRLVHGTENFWQAYTPILLKETTSPSKVATSPRDALTAVIDIG